MHFQCCLTPLALIPYPMSPWGWLREKAQDSEPVDLSSLVSRDKMCSDTSCSHRWRRDMAGISEDKATSMAYGGQQGRRAGSHRHKMKRGVTAAQGGGQEQRAAGTPAARAGCGCQEIACPPSLQPPKYLSGGCTPHYKPSLCLFWSIQSPAKASACPLVGRSPGAGSTAFTPSPSWKAASGLSVRFLRFKPDFPDGWRATRRSSDMPQGHAGPGRRRISSSEGWLVPRSQQDGDSEPCSWAQGVSCGITTTLPKQADGCLGIPRRMHAWDAAPQQVLAPWNGTGGNMPGQAAVQQACGSTGWCSERHRDGAENKIIP